MVVRRSEVRMRAEFGAWLPWRAYSGEGEFPRSKTEAITKHANTEGPKKEDREGSRCAIFFQLHRKGVEPLPRRWQRRMIPFHQRCRCPRRSGVASAPIAVFLVSEGHFGG